MLEEVIAVLIVQLSALVVPCTRHYALQLIKAVTRAWPGFVGKSGPKPLASKSVEYKFATALMLYINLVLKDEGKAVGKETFSRPSMTICRRSSRW